MAQVFSQGFPHWIGSRVIRGATVGSVEEL